MSRVEYPGALHHVRARGNRREAIVYDDSGPAGRRSCAEGVPPGLQLREGAVHCEIDVPLGRPYAGAVPVLTHWATSCRALRGLGWREWLMDFTAE